MLARKYGPIMHLRLGLMPVIVVSSPEAAELFLKTHDLVFASRPPQEESKYISYNEHNLVFAPYGSYWRNMRKMHTLELLSNHKISTVRSMRKLEADLLVHRIREAAAAGVAVDISSEDMVAASMDTSAAATDWTMTELIRHPNLTKKLHRNSKIWRHPVAPLIVHASREDCTVYGFHMPKDARSFINAWAIGRDQRVWTDADKFNPKRFVGSNIDVRQNSD
ncbi:putative Mitochondrial transcription termination factor family protein [Hibiscus syriacus]|uniref:Mitochondrial transcription termination factor family protein n=1 Tax=Hibiscus syriacus TaxID=106335 RepID=A0A6A2X2F6_HIBSY|nr:putative Mitochondrial transcription termination factor family protein [Hibiscus syriacus]